MTSTRRAWTDEEIGFILSPPRGWNARQVGEYIGRSRDSVLVKRGSIRRGWERTREWATPDMVEAVRDSPDVKARVLAEQLMVTQRKIRGIRERIRKETGERATVTKGTAERSPNFRGSRTLLAQTCIGCGQLWGAGEFRPRGATCYTCVPKRADEKAYAGNPERGRSYHKGYQAHMERIVENLATDRVPYRAKHGEPYTEKDLRILERPDLPVVVKAARLGRTYTATLTACTRAGIRSALVTRKQRGQWRIYFDSEEPAA